MINTKEDLKYAAIVFAIAPWDFGGIYIKARDSLLLNSWLSFLNQLLEPYYPKPRKIPFNIDHDNLFGGVDLSRSLNEGRLIKKKGLLISDNEKKIFLIHNAEKITYEVSSGISTALDQCKSWNSSNDKSAFSVILHNFLDDNHSDYNEIPLSLRDRIGIILEFPIFSSRKKNDCDFDFLSFDRLKNARNNLGKVKLTEKNLKEISATTLVLGVEGVRPMVFTGKVAKILAAFEGRIEPNEEDIVKAIRLVVLQKAKQFPSDNNDHKSEENSLEKDEFEKSHEKGDVDPNPNKDNIKKNENTNEEVSDLKNSTEKDKNVEVAAANIPPSLLDEISKMGIKFSSQNKKTGGKKGLQINSVSGQGRYYGVSVPKGKNFCKINFLETIKVSIPYQRIRSAEERSRKKLKILIYPNDLRVYKRKSREMTTTIFLVDASGSAAQNRLGEAKGAVELLLAQCYVRRDRVAVMIFRDKTSDLVLHPTRSLVKAKKTLAGLPGGGGTPLAKAFEESKLLIEKISNDNQSLTLVLLSDGGANVCRDGTVGRQKAHSEALEYASKLKSTRVKSIFIDTGVMSNEKAIAIASSMGAFYYALPRANSKKIIEKINAL